MCGILGTIPKSSETNFRTSLDTLIHRGPDDYGIWSDGKDISLGHRRLAILDLSINGHQPMPDLSGRYNIVYNGEIYNFIELKSELETLGYGFRSESDTEVLLNAYIEWGAGCLQKLNGMWSFAIWDRKKKSLFLSRDRFGQKPLFYSIIGSKFIFASEMKAIMPFLQEVRPSKYFKWMSENIFDYESTEHCLIEGIKRFPAGHYGYYIDGKLSLQRYWNTLDHLIEVAGSYEEQIEEYRELFLDACKLRMRADVPIGTALSGGLDSSATISSMSYIANQHFGERVSEDWQHAFVAAFPGTPLDETYYAKKVVDHIGIKASYIEVDPLKYWNKIDDYLYLFEEIYLTSPIPMIATYKAIKEHGITVTLDGHGADEQFSGYGPSLFYAFPDAWPNRAGKHSIIDAYEGLVPADVDQFNQNHVSSFTYTKFIAKWVLKRILGKGQMARDHNHPAFKRIGSFNQHLYLMTHDTILPTLLRNYDRYSMINSVEIRMPFMDHRLVSYSFSLPWNSKIRNGFTKSIVRDAMSTLMPEEVAYRKTKIGFNSPIVDWMKGPLKEYFMDLINSQQFLQSDYINAEEVKKQIEDVIKDKNTTFAKAGNAWNKLTPFLWEKAILRR